MTLGIIGLLAIVAGFYSGDAAFIALGFVLFCLALGIRELTVGRQTYALSRRDLPPEFQVPYDQERVGL